MFNSQCRTWKTTDPGVKVCWRAPGSTELKGCQPVKTPGGGDVTLPKPDDNFEVRQISEAKSLRSC